MLFPSIHHKSKPFPRAWRFHQKTSSRLRLLKFPLHSQLVLLYWEIDHLDWVIFPRVRIPANPPTHMFFFLNEFPSMLTVAWHKSCSSVVLLALMWCFSQQPLPFRVEGEQILKWMDTPHFALKLGNSPFWKISLWLFCQTGYSGSSKGHGKYCRATIFCLCLWQDCLGKHQACCSWYRKFGKCYFENIDRQLSETSVDISLVRSHESSWFCDETQWAVHKIVFSR